MNGVKNYASLVEKGYLSALNRIKKTFDIGKGYLDEEYLARAREINRETRAAKNSADASHRVALSNVRDELLSKGLSKSGESVNATLRSNLAKNSDFARLDAEAVRSHTENALSRSEKLGDLIKNRLAAEEKLESDMLDAARDEERYENEMRLREEERAEDRERWETETALKEQALKEERERFEAESKRDAFESDRQFAADEEQRRTDNYYEAQRIAISLEKSDGASGGGAVDKKDSESTTHTGYVPDYSADELVNSIFRSMNRQYFPTSRHVPPLLKRRYIRCLTIRPSPPPLRQRSGYTHRLSDIFKYFSRFCINFP